MEKDRKWAAPLISIFVISLLFYLFRLCSEDVEPEPHRDSSTTSKKTLNFLASMSMLEDGWVSMSRNSDCFGLDVGNLEMGSLYVVLLFHFDSIHFHPAPRQMHKLPRKATGMGSPAPQITKSPCPQKISTPVSLHNISVQWPSANDPNIFARQVRGDFPLAKKKIQYETMEMSCS